MTPQSLTGEEYAELVCLRTMTHANYGIMDPMFISVPKELMGRYYELRTRFKKYGIRKGERK